MHTLYHGMKLKRIIGQEETEPKVAWDRAHNWKSSTAGKSMYASMLFVDEKESSIAYF